MGADQNIDWALSTVSTLDWWVEAGVDVAIDEAPRHWLKPAPAKVAPPTGTGELARALPAAPTVPVIAAMPQTLAAFLDWRIGPDAPDAGWPGHALPPEGRSDSALTVIIEMPEREDASAGSLLSGEAGQLFARMLHAIGLARTSIHLVPMCLRRPSAGRIPAESEAMLAAALRHQIALIAPKRVLLFGNAVSRALLGADIAERRGSLRSVNHNDADSALAVQAVASFHPRFLLERPAAKAEAWKDLQLLIQGIDA